MSQRTTISPICLEAAITDIATHPTMANRSPNAVGDHIPSYSHCNKQLLPTQQTHEKTRKSAKAKASKHKTVTTGREELNLA